VLSEEDLTPDNMEAAENVDLSNKVISLDDFRKNRNK
jgi:hypothetical protein